jgi:hypothetical protein
VIPVQYILTQEEYNALTPAKGLYERFEALEIAKQIILAESGFTCIHTPAHMSTRLGTESVGGYCDDCPISKDVEHSVSKHICILNRNYSK